MFHSDYFQIIVHRADWLKYFEAKTLLMNLLSQLVLFIYGMNILIKRSSEQGKLVSDVTEAGQCVRDY